MISALFLILGIYSTVRLKNLAANTKRFIKYQRQFKKLIGGALPEQ